MTFKLQTLKKRADFLRARSGRHCVTPGLILQASRATHRQETDRRGRDLTGRATRYGRTLADKDEFARFGFTATKKLGNAVDRNRIKRRLREAVRQIAPQRARKDYEYVLIGRKSTLKRPFSSLLKDLTIAFGKVHSNSGNNRKGRKPHQANRPRTDIR